MFYVILVLIAAGIVALDQWAKALTLAADQAGKLPSDRILGLFRISHVENRGAIYGILQGQTWLFIVVMVLFLAIIGVIIWRKWVTKKFEWLCLAMIAGGGIGNLIDRAFRGGSVTDMIEFTFVKFPVFNVADCFITVGCVLLLLYVLLFDRGTGEPALPEEDAAEDNSGENPQ